MLYVAASGLAPITAMKLHTALDSSNNGSND